jgi:NADH-quinone oxidoreductase subunit H
MLLYFTIGVMSIGVYGIMIGGWASNKISLIGAVRAASQMISYEVAMGLSLIALLMMTGTLFTRNLSATVWNELECFYQPLSFPYIFNLCVCRNQSNSFDLAECETELIGGYHTEYSHENGFLFIC